MVNRKPVLASKEELGAFSVQMTKDDKYTGLLEYCLAKDFDESTDDGDTHWHVAQQCEWYWKPY